MNPHLPEAPDDLPSTYTRKFRAECGEAFFRACLELAQSYALRGKPAQAILQMNRAFMADVRHPARWCPYGALIYLLRNPGDGFLGNPVRHFQHLATRMSGVRSELRTARAWVCFHIARGVLEHKDFPLDQRQIEREDVVIPELAEVLGRLPMEEARHVREM